MRSSVREVSRQPRCPRGRDSEDSIRGQKFDSPKKSPRFYRRLACFGASENMMRRVELSGGVNEESLADGKRNPRHVQTLSRRQEPTE